MTFEDKYARDEILGRGPMLADYRDEERRPTCGLRFHIPGHLMSSFKILESFSFHLRNKHNGELSKYIKFDEHDLSLFLQVRHKKENEWITFTVEQAKVEMDKNNAIRAQRSRLLSEVDLDGNQSVGSKNNLDGVFNFGARAAATSMASIKTEKRLQELQDGNRPPPKSSVNMPPGKLNGDAGQAGCELSEPEMKKKTIEGSMRDAE